MSDTISTAYQENDPETLPPLLVIELILTLVGYVKFQMKEQDSEVFKQTKCKVRWITSSVTF